MAVTSYTFSLLQHQDSLLKLDASKVSELLKAWRNGHETSHVCLTCHVKLLFRDKPFTTCCKKFYFKPTTCYMVESVSVPTPGFSFLLPNLLKCIQKKDLSSNQEFVVLADPIFWQVPTTLIYDKVMKFVTHTPITKKTKQIQPPSKANMFYKQIQEAPLNHGSYFKRSGGKNTFFRQIAFGKRTTLSMRAMIAPEAVLLRPNEIALPQQIQSAFPVLGKWIILNRMPSLQPENFVALKVAHIWEHDCFGIPLEIIKQMNADFDGDECNLYLLQNVQSQAECEAILNPASEMKSFTSGLKLSPCQDMLVAYYLFYDDIDFLPYKNRSSLSDTFRVIYDLYGSQATFDAFDAMRRFYLDVMKNRIAFAITLQEIQRLAEKGRGSTYEEFRKKVEHDSGCLVTQIRAEAKGSFYHLYLMFGGEHSFWKGLTPLESVKHAMTTIDSLVKSSNIWQPGYGYSKSVYNLQGLHVDYLGQLVDGKDLIVELDVIDAMQYTDLLSPHSFQELLQTHLSE